MLTNCSLEWPDTYKLQSPDNLKSIADTDPAHLPYNKTTLHNSNSMQGAVGPVPDWCSSSEGANSGGVWVLAVL